MGHRIRIGSIAGIEGRLHRSWALIALLIAWSFWNRSPPVAQVAGLLSWIDLAGNVGPVDGVAAKVRGALLVPAEVFLVPDTHVEVARDAAPAELEVIGVATLREAIHALND